MNYAQSCLFFGALFVMVFVIVKTNLEYTGPVSAKKPKVLMGKEGEEKTGEHIAKSATRMDDLRG